MSGATCGAGREECSVMALLRESPRLVILRQGPNRVGSRQSEWYNLITGRFWELGVNCLLLKSAAVCNLFCYRLSGWHAQASAA